MTSVLVQTKKNIVLVKFAPNLLLFAFFLLFSTKNAENEDFDRHQKIQQLVWKHFFISLLSNKLQKSFLVFWKSQEKVVILSARSFLQLVLSENYHLCRNIRSYSSFGRVEDCRAEDCCVFWPAFGCCAHPKAGSNIFSTIFPHHIVCSTIYLVYFTCKIKRSLVSFC